MTTPAPVPLRFVLGHVNDIGETWYFVGAGAVHKGRLMVVTTTRDLARAGSVDNVVDAFFLVDRLWATWAVIAQPSGEVIDRKLYEQNQG